MTSLPPMISDIALRDISSGIRLATAHEARVLAKYASKDRGINDKAEVGETPGEPEQSSYCRSKIYVGTTGESSCELPCGHSGDHRQGTFKWGSR